MNIKTKRTLNILLIILLIALALRSYKLDDKEQGTDESWSTKHINQLLEGTFIENVGSHAHPPLFYMILTPFWIIGGNLLLRILMVSSGLVSIILVFLLTKKIFKTEIGLLSAFLLTMSPFHLIYSQHIRSYIFLMMLSLISIYLLIKYIKEESKITLAILTFLYIIIFYINTIAALFIISQFICFFTLKFFKIKRLKIKPILVSGLITGISWLFWLPFFIKQYTYNIIEERVVTLTKLNLLHIPNTFYKYAVALDISSAIKSHIYVVLLAAILILLVFYAYFRLFKESKTKFTILSISLFVPTILLAVVGIFIPIFSFRYVSYLQPLFILMLAKGFTEIRNKKIRIVLLIITILIWLIIIKFYWSVFINIKWGHNFAL